MGLFKKKTKQIDPETLRKAEESAKEFESAKELLKTQPLAALDQIVDAAQKGAPGAAALAASLLIENDDLASSWKTGIRLTNRKTAMSLLDQAVEAGDVMAMYQQGLCFLEGTFGFDQNKTRFTTLESKANRKEPGRMAYLLYLHFIQKGDGKQALDWLKDSAKRSWPQGLENYVNTLIYGNEKLGLKADLDEARKQAVRLSKINQISADRYLARINELEQGK